MSALVIGALGGKIAAITNRGVRQATAGSYTYTPTVTGWHLVRAQAGGGGGKTTVGQQGGQAGMYVEMRHFLTAGVAYPYTVGIGGVGGSTPTAGGNTSFTGPHITQVAIGGSGGGGGSAARYDASPATGAAALDQSGVIGGAMGGSNLPVQGGYCGAFLGGASTASGGGGGASKFAAGGTVNTAGTFGSGGGGGASAGAGGAGLIEIEYIGTN
jgi:hypothetical protein